MNREIHLDCVRVGMLSTCCYILHRDGFEGCVVIDPGAEPERILEKCGDQPVRAILLTHGHFDHIGGVDEVTEADTKLYIHRLDQPLLKDPTLNASDMADRAVTCRGADVLLQDDDPALRAWADEKWPDQAGSTVIRLTPAQY